MGQRVKIQYSVELKDLKSEVNRLFKNIMSELDSINSKRLGPTIELGTSGLDRIHSLREHLAKTDIMLDDLQQILEGYVRYKAPVRQEEKSQVLADQISKFKDSVSENAD